MIKQDEFKKLMTYHPETGTFTWNPRTADMFTSEWQCQAWNSKWANKTASTSSGNGSDYLFIRMLVDGKNKKFRAHRAAYLWMTGKLPRCIDHIDQDKTNNKWSNLRAATHSENGINRKPISNNTSGVSGVHFDKSRNKWLANIKQNGKHIHLGRFEHFEDAKAARVAAEVERYGEFAYTN